MSGKTIGLIAALSLSICVIVGCIAGMITLDHKRYTDCRDNPPTVEEVTVDLKDVFLTDDIEIYSTDHDYLGDKMYYMTKANNLKYKVCYVVKKAGLCSYYWHYYTYAQIGEERHE